MNFRRLSCGGNKTEWPVVAPTDVNNGLFPKTGCSEPLRSGKSLDVSTLPNASPA